MPRSSRRSPTAAVVGVPHQRWSERPLLLIVPRQPGQAPSHQRLLTFLADRLPRWWLPDASEPLAELPLTATGKVSKKTLREQFADYSWP
ncbi:3-methylmercaptopropionyl-CoA ligase [compost metagenome]